MESPSRNSVKLLVELEPRRRAFWSSLRVALHRVPLSAGGEVGLWRDVFVRQQLPWRRFLESAVLHAGALAMVWMVSLAWTRQQSMLARPAFDRSSLITYSPEEYLAPLDTGRSESERASQGDPVYAKQPILSVPTEADNRTQTIVTPADLRLDRDVALPNIVAVGPPVQTVPLEATRLRMAAPETNVVAPAPELNAARSRTGQDALNSDVIAPPPEVAVNQVRGVAGPDAAVVAPPPELPKSVRGAAGQINIGPSQVVAPAPQLVVAVQHSVAGRGIGNLAGAGVQPVAPAPSMNGTGGVRSGGRLIALGIHPAAALGPVVAPEGRRKGTFAATQEGRLGGSGTPGQVDAAAGVANGSGKGNKSGNGQSRGDSSLPSGLHVGAPNSVAIAPTAGTGGRGKNGKAEGDERLVASAKAPRTSSSSHPASPVPEDKVTEADRRVFGGKRLYSMTMNMPNLNSATGSWVIRFAELKASRQPGELLAPVATEGSDPGYPLELMRNNVQGTVTLYAVIDSAGSVGEIRVLSSPDARLDRYATGALARWKFLPATKDGTPVTLEAVVMIPFRLKKNF